jgi:hypothetical protein
MFTKLRLWISGAALAVAIVVGAFFAGGVNGKNSAKAEQERRAADSLRKAREIEKTADAMHIDDVRSRINSRLRD